VDLHVAETREGPFDDPGKVGDVRMIPADFQRMEPMAMKY
jgi:hypothetical protein